MTLKWLLNISVSLNSPCKAWIILVSSYPYMRLKWIMHMNWCIKRMQVSLAIRFLNCSTKKYIISDDIKFFLKKKKKKAWGWRSLAWWLSGAETICRCRRHGFDPWTRRTPCDPELLSPRATIIEPVALEPGCHNYWGPRTLELTLCSKRRHHGEGPVCHNWRVASACCSWEKTHAAMKTQHSQKQIEK